MERPDIYDIMKSAVKSSAQHITIVVADDHPLIREGSTTILNSQKDISAAASAIACRPLKSNKTKETHKYVPQCLRLGHGYSQPA
jgi:hypothetical protein